MDESLKDLKYWIDAMKEMESLDCPISANEYAGHAFEEVVKICGGIARLSEIRAAEREGRLRILPCKVGDELCADYGDEGRETGVVTNIEINIETEMGVFWPEDIGVLVDVKKETANAKDD